MHIMNNSNHILILHLFSFLILQKSPEWNAMPVLQVFKDNGWLDSCVKIYTHPSTNNGNWPILLPRVLTTNHLQRGHSWSTDIFVMIEHCWFVLLTCENVTSSHHRNNPLGQFCGPMVPKLYQNVSNLINYTNCHSSYIIVKSFFYICAEPYNKRMSMTTISGYTELFLNHTIISIHFEILFLTKCWGKDEKNKWKGGEGEALGRRFGVG